MMNHDIFRQRRPPPGLKTKLGPWGASIDACSTEVQQPRRSLATAFNL
jgi:hypothetical protein